MASPTDVDLRPFLKTLSQSINRPSVTLAAIVIALALGAMRLPILEYLRPLGDFYIALLKICVLPFLLSTIPFIRAMRTRLLTRLGNPNGTRAAFFVSSMVRALMIAVLSSFAINKGAAEIRGHWETSP